MCIFICALASALNLRHLGSEKLNLEIASIGLACGMPVGHFLNYFFM